MIVINKNEVSNIIAPLGKRMSTERHKTPTMVHHTPIGDVILPTYECPIGMFEMTHLFLTNHATSEITQIAFAPISPTSIRVFAVVANSPMTLATLFIPDSSDLCARVTSCGEKGTRLCLLEFESWTWPIFNEKTTVEPVPNTWFDIQTSFIELRHDPSTIAGLSSQPLLEFDAPAQGDVETIRVINNTTREVAFVKVQEMRGGVSRWFYEVNGRVLWCGMGRIKSENSSYRLYWRSGSLFAVNSTAEICVAPIGALDESNIILVL